MRNFLATVAAIAVCGLVTVTAARADATHDLGGPVRNGNMCWVGTDGANGVFGYWNNCPKPAKTAHHAKKMKS